MAFKINATTVVNDSGDISWSRIDNTPTNLITTITIQGSGTTLIQANTLTSGTLILTKT